MKALLFAALLLAIPASLPAQRGGFTHSSVGHATFPDARFGHYGYAGHGYYDQRSPGAGYGYYPLDLFDPLYSDYLFSTGYPVASQPPMVFLQSPPAPSAPGPEVSRIPSQPLMIELQGDRYVQVSGNQPSQSQMIDPAAGRTNALRSGSSTTSDSTPESRPAVLIFRDGRRQEVSAYTITGGALYGATDYATTGAWNQKIELSSLNLPETIAANNSRGQQFKLPSAPNEVVVGP